MVEDTKLTWTSNGIFVRVWFDRWDALQHERAIICYEIGRTTILGEASGDVLHGADDLTIIPKDGGILTSAMVTLAEFMSAWCESIDYGEHHATLGENSGLFPATLLDAVDINMWEEIAATIISELNITTEEDR